jgi:hypothetical protein
MEKTHTSPNLIISCRVSQANFDITATELREPHMIVHVCMQQPTNTERALKSPAAPRLRILPPSLRPRPSGSD